MKELSIREIQLLSLDLLKEIHAFCEAEGIRYSMAYGSLIGVVRHKGFIPWDDDVDLVFPRPDYERFVRGFRSARARVAIPGEDSYQPIARVYDTRDTVAFTKYPFKRGGERAGVWIDIYPMDNVSDDPAEFDLHAEECRALYGRMVRRRKMLAGMADFRHVPPHWHAGWRWLRSRWWRLRSGFPDLMAESEVQNRLMRKYPWGSTGHISQLAIRGWVYRDHLPAGLFDDLVLMPFEDMEVRVPRDYDTFLVPQYPDYMTPPPEDKRVWHTRRATKFYWKDK
ncbi:MAG: LicD family protein [Muribaculaceae bacterium]|nr:LicD family protein [Muribaculaceae bacterium]